MKKFLLIIPFISLSLSVLAQDDDKGPKTFCRDDIDKKAMKLYEKAIDKKKYKKPERISFLMESLQIEPDFAEANLFMGQEMIVRAKLEELSFSPMTPYFKKAIASCPQIHSEPYYYIGFAYYEEAKNDSAKKYLEKFIAIKDDDDTKYAKDNTGEMYNAK